MSNHRYQFLYLPVYLRVQKFTLGKRILLYLFQAAVIFALVGFHLAAATTLWPE